MITTTSNIRILWKYELSAVSFLPRKDIGDQGFKDEECFDFHHFSTVSRALSNRNISLYEANYRFCLRGRNRDSVICKRIEFSKNNCTYVFFLNHIIFCFVVWIWFISQHFEFIIYRTQKLRVYSSLYKNIENIGYTISWERNIFPECKSS